MIGPTPRLVLSRYFVLRSASMKPRWKERRTMMPQKMHLTSAKFTQIRRAADTHADGERICVPLQSVGRVGDWNRRTRVFCASGTVLAVPFSLLRRTPPPPSLRAVQQIVSSPPLSHTFIYAQEFSRNSQVFIEHKSPFSPI